MGRNGNTIGYSTIVRGDADAAHGDRRRRRQGPLRDRPDAGRPDRAARGDRGVARRQGDGLVLDAGAVRGARRGRADDGDPRVARARDRAAARRRLRRQVRLPLRGSRRGARPQGRPPGEARVLAPRGVLRRRPSPRGDGDRARDRRAAATGRSSRARRGSCSTRAPTAARAASSRRWPRCTRTARTSSRTSSIHSYLNYSNNQPSSSIRAPTAPQVCWALEQHMDELAAALGLDAGRAAAPHGDPRRLGHGHGPGARPHHDARDARPCGRDDRLRRRAARRRGDRRRDRLVAVLRDEVRRVREAQPGRHRDDRDRRPGERHRLGDGDADLRRRGARHATRGLHAPLPGHGRRARGTGARAARRRRSTPGAR